MRCILRECLAVRASKKNSFQLRNVTFQITENMNELMIFIQLSEKEREREERDKKKTSLVQNVVRPGLYPTSSCLSVAVIYYHRTTNTRTD